MMVTSTTTMKPHIVYFGIYSTGAAYPRNRNLIASLRANGCRVTELQHNMLDSHNARIEAAHSLCGRIGFAFQLVWSYLVLTVKFLGIDHCDAIIVGHPGYFHIHLARLLRVFKRDRPALILDIFIPLYNMVVEERKLFSERGALARLLHRFERSCCDQADFNMLDTHSHCDYMKTEFALAADRLVATPVGSSLPATSQLCVPRDGAFKIVFVGTCIPLQGIETILCAAGQLLAEKDIRFSIVGCKKLTESEAGRQWRARLTNVNFIDWIETEALPRFMGEHQLALGIFGNTDKSARVIPTKVFDSCKMGMPFISADTPAIREVFTHKLNALLIPAASPEHLSRAIVELKNDSTLRQKLQQGSQKIQREVFATERLCAPLLERMNVT